MSISAIPITKLPQIIITLVILEFSVILSWAWMMGDFSQIRFGRWPISEWLINYQGGFVRRGLIGELLYQLYPEQALVPKLYPLTFYFYFLYCCLFIVLYRLSKIQDLSLFIVMLLIPGGIFQMAISSSFYTRKEILFLIFFGILLLIYYQITKTRLLQKRIWIIVFIILAMTGSIFLTLSHEAFLMMCFPFVTTLFWLLKKEQASYRWVHWCFIAFITIIPITFFACTIMHGSLQISENIWDSLMLHDRLIIAPNSPYTVYAAIGGIGWTKLQNLSTLYGVFVSGGWVIWLCFAIAQYGVIGYVLGRALQDQEQEQISQKLSILSIPLFCSLSMFLIGSDWGRWIASSGNHVLLFSFLLLSQKLNKVPNQYLFRIWSTRLLKKPYFIWSRWLFWIIIIYELIFKMPECCVQYPFIFIQYSSFIKILSNLF